MPLVPPLHSCAHAPQFDRHAPHPTYEPNPNTLHKQGPRRQAGRDTAAAAAASIGYRASGQGGPHSSFVAEPTPDPTQHTATRQAIIHPPRTPPSIQANNRKRKDGGARRAGGDGGGVRPRGGQLGGGPEADAPHCGRRRRRRGARGAGGAAGGGCVIGLVGVAWFGLVWFVWID